MRKNEKKTALPKTKLSKAESSEKEKASEHDNSEKRSSFGNEVVDLGWIKAPLMIVIGIGIGIIASYIFYISKPEIFLQPIIANAVRATVAALPTTVSPTQPSLIPTISPTPPIFQLQPTLTFDVRIVNEFSTFTNPTEIMKINATKEIIISIDPDGLHQATCSNWNIQPEPTLSPKEDGCNLAFYAVTYKETNVTVNVTIEGITVPKSFVFHP